MAACTANALAIAVAPRSDEAPTTLPRGPHKLSREAVALSQRTRLLRALAEEMSQKGYAATSVADVLRRARISRETFYQQFSSKQDCFIAAYEQASTMILAQLEREAASAGAPLQRFRRTLTLYLDALAREPAFARLFMVEVHSAGEQALERRAQIQQRFTELMIDGFGARGQTERFACETLVAAIITMVTARLAAGDLEGLRSLRDPLTALVREALAHPRKSRRR
jgi:AcrR family transcriptional regulator